MLKCTSEGSLRYASLIKRLILVIDNQDNTSITAGSVPSLKRTDSESSVLTRHHVTPFDLHVTKLNHDSVMGLRLGHQ